MRAALWLAARELRVRWRRAAFACGFVAALGAAGSGLELVSRAREAAVAARIDDMGAPLTLAPRGATAGDIARLALPEAPLPPGLGPAAARALGGALRAAEPRLVLRRAARGRDLVVVGTDVMPSRLRPAAPGEAWAGAELVRSLRAGDAVDVGGLALRVAGFLPRAGGAEDFALRVSLATAERLAGRPGPNAIDLYLRPGARPEDAARALAAALPDASVVLHARGEVAERETQGSLARHRQAAYAVLAAVGLVCLVIGAYVDAADRRREVASLVALGASRGTVLAALVLRSALLAGVGALAGALVGAGAAAAQDLASAGALRAAWDLPLRATLVAAALGAAAALPTAVAGALRDPVADLQDA